MLFDGEVVFCLQVVSAVLTAVGIYAKIAKETGWSRNLFTLAAHASSHKL